MLQAQLTGAATDGAGPVYFEGFIFKVFPVSPVSEKLPTLLLSPSASNEVVLLVKRKNKEKSIEIKFIAIGVAGGRESVGELSAPALFSCWELFLHSLGAVSVGEEKDAKGKYAENKEYLRPYSIVCV